MIRTSFDFFLVALVGGVALAIWTLNVVQLLRWIV